MRVRDDERTCHSQPGTSGGQTESPAQNHLEDIASSIPQREANRDLTPLFIDHTGDGSVDSKSGEQQGSGRKKRHHFHRESPHEQEQEKGVRGLNPANDLDVVGYRR
jgi:hypothetical protein